MRKKLYLLFILIVSIEMTLGKDNKIKSTKAINKKYSNLKVASNKFTNGRPKRSLDDENERLLSTREKNTLGVNTNYELRYDDIIDNDKNKLEQESPFWGTRGRRDSSSVENYAEKEYALIPPDNKYTNCKHCYKALDYSKDRRDELVSPFWGNRGRRGSNEIGDVSYRSSASLFDGIDRKQENDPFWGTRGRRLDETPFWGNRGRRESTTISENQGRTYTAPYWPNQGSRDEVEPFWGNRGRRNEYEPFWGQRGKRQESEPFWGNRGRRENSDLYPVNHRQQKEDLKKTILSAMNSVENDIETLSRLRRSKDTIPNSFWNSRGRDSQLKYLFSGARYKLPVPNFMSKGINHGIKLKSPESSTVLDDRVFVEQPRYILVERSSRSSAEDDPYFISRGKKKIHNIELFQAARDRRGVIEELVKSVRNDPFYIARGKKDSDKKKIGNTTVINEEFGKAKELICATIDLMMIKKDNNKVKREDSDNERDRRTILKKLAAQLQIDPYFVSRGKKNDDSGGKEDNLEYLFNEIYTKCH